tara:strand:+ start:7574 stop:9481 length:1908 start_codon:yes stop_codon:yes gene_type:complete
MESWPTDLEILVSDDGERTAYKRAWDLSVLFVSGNQWLAYDDNLRQYEVARPRRTGASRVTVNLLLNIYRNLLSRLSINYPSVAVVPATPDAEDSTKAKSMELLLEYHWQQAEMKEIITNLIKNMLVMGTAALHSYYDPDKDVVKTESVSAYDLFFEKGVRSPDESSFVAIRTFHTKDALKVAYPDKEEEIDGAEEVSPLAGPTGYAKPKNRVEVYEFYWRDGRHAIALGNTYLFKESGYPVDPFPVQVIRYTEIPTRLWGLGLIQPLVDLQWFYNKARTQMMSNVELMSNPKWLIPKTAGVDNASFTDKAGEKIYYNAAGGEPRMVQPVPLPGYVLDNLTRIQAEMSDVSGIHSVSLGKRAVNVSSGAAIQTLADKDMSQLAATQAAIERAVRNVAKTIFLLMKAHYTKGKMIRMMDDLGGIIHQEIEATDILEDPEVFIQAGSLFRREAHDRDAKVLEMFQLGLLEKEQVVSELSFRTANSKVSEQVRSLHHAQDILAAAIKGMSIEIYATDDLKVFERVFHEFMQTEDYYSLDKERADYIADIYLSIITHSQGEQAYQEAMFKRKVFPRQQMPGINDRNKAAALALQQSDAAFNQLLGEQVGAAQKTGNLEDAVSRSAQRGEALISPIEGGM